MSGPQVYAPEYLRNQKDKTLHGIADMIEEQIKTIAKVREENEQMMNLDYWHERYKAERARCERMKAIIEKMECECGFETDRESTSEAICCRCQALTEGGS